MRTTILRLRTALGIFALSAGFAAPAVAGGDDKGKHKDKVEVEGEVGSVDGKCPSLTVVVGTAKVTVDSKTRFDDGTCADLSKGKRVEVDAVMKGDTLTATEIDFDT
jgi:hypothetical protein